MPKLTCKMRTWVLENRSNRTPRLLITNYFRLLTPPDAQDIETYIAMAPRISTRLAPRNDNRLMQEYENFLNELPVPAAVSSTTDVYGGPGPSSFGLPMSDYNPAASGYENPMFGTDRDFRLQTQDKLEPVDMDICSQGSGTNILHLNRTFRARAREHKHRYQR